MAKFFLRILSPEKQLFAGEAEMLTFNTVGGELSIMAGHQRSIIPVTEGIIEIKQNGKISEAFGGEGFAEITPKDTVLLLQVCEWPEEIDLDRAISDKEKFEKIMKTLSKSDDDYELSRHAYIRAVNRIKLKARSNK